MLQQLLGRATRRLNVLQRHHELLLQQQPTAAVLSSSSTTAPAAAAAGVQRVHHRAMATTAAAAGGSGGAAAREIAVVGGGVSGLFAASVLSRHGHKVTVFDLGKHAPGGRLTTRKTSWKGLQFDHGCQFVRPVSQAFRDVCEEWVAAGALAPWQGAVVRYDAVSGGSTSREAFIQQQQQAEQGSAGGGPSLGFLDVLGPGPLFVGSPSCNAITQHLAAEAASHGADVRNDVKVAKAAYDGSTSKWVLEGAVRTPMNVMADLKSQPPFTPWNLGVFDALVLADKMTGCPGTPGYVEVSGSTAATKMQQAMAGVGSKPMLALLLAYQPQETPLQEQAAAGGADGAGAASARPVLQLPFDAAAVANSEEIQWICLDSNKPGRARADGIQSLVALATPTFSESLIQRNADGSLPPQTPELLSRMVPPMFAALQRALAPLLSGPAHGGRLQEPAFVQVHRWGSALPAAPFGSSCLTAETARVAACGDFCLGGSVENAVVSAQAAADAVIKMLEQQQ